MSWQGFVVCGASTKADYTLLSPHLVVNARGTISRLIDCAAVGRGDLPMSDDRTVPPFVYEGLDPVTEPKSALAQAVEAAKEAAHRVGDTIDKGRKPGMPLSILSSVAREAPLGSLLIAFLIGIAVGRRR
jgi:hypothetical protein